MCNNKTRSNTKLFAVQIALICYTQVTLVPDELIIKQTIEDVKEECWAEKCVVQGPSKSLLTCLHSEPAHSLLICKVLGHWSLLFICQPFKFSFKMFLMKVKMSVRFNPKALIIIFSSESILYNNWHTFKTFSH